MARIRPVEWRAIRDALVFWVRNASEIETVWGNQAAPQPAYPYASLTIIGPGPYDPGIHDHEDWSEVDDSDVLTGNVRYVGQRELALSVQVNVGPPDNADPDADGLSVAEAIIVSLSDPAVKKQLADAGLSLRDRGRPTTLDLVVGSEWISRQLVEFRFGYVSVLGTDTGLDESGYFDKVEVSSTIEGIKNPGGSLELDNEIFDPNA